MSKKQPSFLEIVTEYFDKYDVFPKSAFQGFAERLNSRFTILIFAVAIAVLCSNNYFESKITCFLPTAPNMKLSFSEMFHDYCYVNGSVVILPGEKVPSSEYGWNRLNETRKIAFYQWIPLVLLFQMLMFLIPWYIWNHISGLILDTDFDKVISKASECRYELDENKRTECIRKVSKDMERVMRFKKSDSKKLMISYWFIKVLYLVNVVGQLALMFLFLFRSQPFPTMSMNVNEDKEVFLAFPRKVFCHMPNVITPTGYASYTAQCILYMNVFNHVIYTFLYYWFMLVSLAMLLSTVVFLPLFTFRSQYSFIKHLLKVSRCYRKEDKVIVKKFIKEYLKGDGVFLFRKLDDNVNSFVTGDILENVFMTYRDSI